MSLFRSVALVCCFAFALPAQAMTMKECSEKFAEAKKTGTLNGAKWSDFRVSECKILSDAAPAQQAAEIPAGVTFPDKIDAKYATERPAQQRMKTCLDSYRTNRDAKTLNGMKWVQKGGGYYSACSARLKGNS